MILKPKHHPKGWLVHDSILMKWFGPFDFKVIPTQANFLVILQKKRDKTVHLENRFEDWLEAVLFCEFYGSQLLEEEKSNET